MKILVIGNGFDLAHSLPTSYSDFLDFLKACKDYEKSGYDCERGPYYDFYSTRENTKILSEISELMNTDNRLLEYFLRIYKDRCANGKKGWIDFEGEIASIVKQLENIWYWYRTNKNNNRYILDLPTEYMGLANEILFIDRGRGTRIPAEFEYGEAKHILDSLNKTTRLLEIYLSEYVGSLPIVKRLPECMNQNFTHILSFNYTNTFQKLYDPDCKADYCYIHGEVDSSSNLEKCNLVLGIEEYQDDLHKDSANFFVWFKKFYQRIYKGTSSDYIDWLRDYEEYCKMVSGNIDSLNEVYIYGHSLDVTDRDILSRLILEPYTSTYIYYYSRSDLSKKIENLVKVIGEEELISRTGGNKRTIRFVNAAEPVIK